MVRLAAAVAVALMSAIPASAQELNLAGQSGTRLRRATRPQPADSSERRGGADSRRHDCDRVACGARRYLWRVGHRRTLSDRPNEQRCRHRRKIGFRTRAARASGSPASRAAVSVTTLSSVITRGLGCRSLAWPAPNTRSSTLISGSRSSSAIVMASPFRAISVRPFTITTHYSPLTIHDCLG